MVGMNHQHFWMVYDIAWHQDGFGFKYLGAGDTIDHPNDLSNSRYICTTKRIQLVSYLPTGLAGEFSKQITN